MKKPQKAQKPAPPPDDKGEQKYQPPAWAFRYLAACLDWDIKATVSARCKAANVSRTTYYEVVCDENFVNWLNDRFERTIHSEHREVRTALLKRCIAGDLAAIELWHQLYADFIPTQRNIVDSDLSGLSNEQLAEIARGLAEGTPQGTRPKVH